MSKAESSLTQLSCCKASPDVCFTFSTFGLYFLQIMLEGFSSFLFLLDPFLFFVPSLFINDCAVWYFSK